MALKQDERFYGNVIPDAVRKVRTENLINTAEQDLVRAHLSSNFAYFGGIDKTLSGFYILDNEGDDYYLCDLRGGGQIYWQDHETREISLAFDSIDAYTGFKKELAEQQQADDFDPEKIRKKWAKGLKKRPTPHKVSTKELADRYQWLMWFLAKPMIDQDGVVVLGKRELVGRAIGQLKATWSTDDTARAAFKREKAACTGDQHLALYWLLHAVFSGDRDMESEVRAIMKSTKMSLFVEFATASVQEKISETFGVALPDIRSRMADMCYLLYVSEIDPRSALLTASLSLDIDERGVEVMEFINARQLYTALRTELTAIASSCGKKTTNALLLPAYIDVWEGKNTSAAAVMLCTELQRSSNTDWSLMQGPLWKIAPLVDDQELVIDVVKKCLEIDPYYFELLKVLYEAQIKTNQVKDAAQTKTTIDQLAIIRPWYQACSIGKSDTEAQAVLKKVAKQDITMRQFFAARVLARVSYFTRPAILASLRWIVSARTYPRAKLMRSGLRTLVFSDVQLAIGDMRKECPKPDTSLVSELESLMCTETPAIFAEETAQSEIVKGVLSWLAGEKAFTSKQFDHFFDLIEQSKDPKVQADLIETLFSEKTPMICAVGKLTPLQTTRCVALMNTLSKPVGKQQSGRTQRLASVAGHVLFQLNPMSKEEMMKMLGR